MASVSALWVGDSLSLPHKIALASFVYYKHTVKLYVYNLDLEVPKGVIKVDARNIVPESEIFYHHGQLAAFSDLFRYYMIKQTGEVWVDADTLCLSSYFFEDKEFMFIRQTKVADWEKFAGSILKLPSNHPIVNDLIIGSREKISNGLDHWCDIGPIILTDKIKEYGMEDLAIDDDLVNMFTLYTDTSKFWDPKYKNKIIRMSKRCYSATFFTGGLTARGIDKNTIIPGSAIEHFYNKFVQ
jgi:hypothetical protein